VTRNDFIAGVTEWWELIEFCSDEDCDVCSYIFHRDELEEKIKVDLARVCRDDTLTWEEIRERLCNIDDEYEYYSENDEYLEYTPMDAEEFQYRKDEVLEWMDDYGSWDEEADDEYIEEEDVPDHEPEAHDEEDEPVPQEEFHVTELISMCVVDVRALQEADRKGQEEESVRVSKDMDSLFLPF